MFKNLSEKNLLKKWGLLPLICLLCLMLFLEINSAALESQTIDEGAHLVSGYSYVVNKKVQLNPEHPPLLKTLAGLSVKHLKPNFIWNDLTNESQWDVSRAFLYQLKNNADTIITWGRLPTMIISLFLACFVFYWAFKLQGAKAGFLALILFVFDANILTHSRYITTDIAISFGFVTTLFFFYKYAQNPNKKNLFLTAIFFALAQMFKFSAVLLVPMLIFLSFVAKKINFKKFILLTATCFVATVLLAFVLYFGDLGVYIEGFKELINHEKGGHSAYLLGQYDKHGFWYYFPIAFMVKTPLTTILLLIMATSIFINKLSERLDFKNKKYNFKNKIKYIFSKIKLSELILISFPIFYFIISMINRINLGIRHLLPIYPFLFIFIAVFIFEKQNYKYFKHFKKIALVLIFVFIIESLVVYPNYLSYFSPLVGGSSQGHKYLLDSNLDWGQDLKKLKNYLDKNNINEPIYLHYFGEASPKYYNINYKIPNSIIKKGWLAISIQNIMNEDKNYAWLLDKEPYAKIGGSIYLYYLE